MLVQYTHNDRQEAGPGVPKHPLAARSSIALNCVP